MTEKAELCFSTDEVGPFKVKSKNLSHLSYLFVPYFDKDGVSMDEGGGTLFMETEGRLIGPGHAGIYDHSEGSEAQYVFTFHFYDLNNDGVGTLGTRILTWSNDGWPELTQDIFSPSQ